MRFCTRLLTAACTAVLALCSTASAVSANTVREKYGLSDVMDAAQLKEEFANVQGAVLSIREVELYNKVIQDSSTEDIDAEISALKDRASTFKSSVVSGIDLTFEEILETEAQYRQVTKELYDLIKVRDAYTLDEIAAPTAEEEALMARAETLERHMKRAISFADIGNLKYYPVIGYTYRVNSKFGPRNDPTGMRGYSFHGGIDLYAPNGTPIGAWFSGTVESCGYSSGGGNYVWIDHGSGVKTYYCHLSRIDVKSGQQVDQGDQIALSGNTGIYTTGPHLHMGLYIDGTAVDPGVILG